jgi:hypothetical protein
LIHENIAHLQNAQSNADIRSVRDGTPLVSFTEKRRMTAAKAITHPFISREFALA